MKKHKHKFENKQKDKALAEAGQWIFAGDLPIRGEDVPGLWVIFEMPGFTSFNEPLLLYNEFLNIYDDLIEPEEIIQLQYRIKQSDLDKNIECGKIFQIESPEELLKEMELERIRVASVAALERID
jgi:hypothetical protein